MLPSRFGRCGPFARLRQYPLGQVPLFPPELPMSEPVTRPDPDRQWFIIGRWQEFEGEAIANLVRIAAILIFYAAHAIQHYWMLDDAARAADADFHRLAT